MPWGKEQAANWYRLNAKRIKKHKRELYAADPKKKIASVREWQEDNKDKMREYTHRYRAKKKKISPDTRDRKESVHYLRAEKLGLLGNISPGVIDTLYKRQGGMCAYDIHWCKNSLGDNFHVDHIMPFYLGGLHEDSNLQLLCPECSMAKGKKHPDTFFSDHVRFLRWKSSQV